MQNTNKTSYADEPDSPGAYCFCYKKSKNKRPAKLISSKASDKLSLQPHLYNHYSETLNDQT